ncbi:MAG TPA: acetyl-CoA carboxylase, carboxyltransferase subunit beta [Nitrospiria bacterium]|nr:acetyl-CoA carboxylase, carboxyltransferase subunit beta [Nitrospiria bacterium]
MAWFQKKDKDNEKEPSPGDDVAGEKRGKSSMEGLWVKCNHCREIIYRKELDRNLKVCPKCDYHFPITVEERIGLLLDEGSFKEWDADLSPADPLGFRDTQRYRDRLKTAQEQTGRRDAMVSGSGTVEGRTIALCVFHFGFMGGSMGSVVGERIVRAAERAEANRSPLVVVTASGGARMQEGILSLMQMAKTSAAVGRLQRAGLPYVSILTDPTYGGVSASIATLGDVILAEPKALIGFAGPRVIEQTIKQQLPPGFQRAEFLLEHGMIDAIVERKKMKGTLASLLSCL